MLAERNEVAQSLDALISILSNAELPITAEDRENKIAQLVQGKTIVQNRKYHVTTLGIFSTGKSTLINSMIGGNYLPAADHPTTARITEIRPSNEAFIVFQADKTPTDKELDIVKKFLSCIGYKVGKDGELQVQTKMVLGLTNADVEEIKGLVITGVSPHSLVAKDIRKILAFLGTEIIKVDVDAEKFVNELKNVFTDIVIGLPVDDWMADIVLTDAPGTGSIVDAHDTVINKIIPESQLVLHIVDAERVGDSTDKFFAERIANFQHRKIFYVLNKIDRMSSEGCEEAQMELKKTFPSGTTADCLPEIIQVSALCALLAIELKSGATTVEAVMDNRKVSLGYLYSREEFRDASGDQQRIILCEELWAKSNFTEFRDRVSTYLSKENKQMAIVEDAWNLIRGLALDVKGALDDAIRMLESNNKVSDLEKEKAENQKKRGDLKKVADRALGKYKLEIEGGISEADGKQYEGARARVEASLRDSQKNIKSELCEWLDAHYNVIEENPAKMQMHIQRVIENAVTKARNVATDHAVTAVAHLKEEIVDVLREARDLTFDGIGKSDRPENPDLDTSIALLGLAITGGGTAAGAATGAGIGAAICSFVPGVGTALGAGIGAGVGALAGLISSGVYVSKKGKRMRIDKITDQVDACLGRLFFDGGKIMDNKTAPEVVPYIKIIVDDLHRQCNRFRDDLQKKIDQRFKELDERADAIIRDISSTKEEKERKMGVYTELAKQCSTLIKKAR